MTLTIYTDASYHRDVRRAGIGVVLVHDEKTVGRASASINNIDDSHVAEGRAALLGLKLGIVHASAKQKTQEAVMIALLVVDAQSLVTQITTGRIRTKNKTVAALLAEISIEVAKLERVGVRFFCAYKSAAADRFLAEADTLSKIK